MCAYAYTASLSGRASITVFSVRSNPARVCGATRRWIEADRLKPGRTSIVDHAQGIGLRLNPVDRALYVAIEVLHAQAHAIEAHRGQVVDRLAGHGAGRGLSIEYSRPAASTSQSAAQLFHQRRKLRRSQECGSSAAEVKLFDRARASEERGLELDLPCEANEVCIGALAAARDDPIAAAIETGAGTERNVNVERERARAAFLIALASRASILLFAEPARELNRRG